MNDLSFNCYVWLYFISLCFMSFPKEILVLIGSEQTWNLVRCFSRKIQAMSKKKIENIAAKINLKRIFKSLKTSILLRFLFFGYNFNSTKTFEITRRKLLGMANHAAVVVYYSTTWFTLRSNIGLHIFKGKICTNLSVFEVNPFRDIKNRFMKFNNGLTVRRNSQFSMWSICLWVKNCDV